MRRKVCLWVLLGAGALPACAGEDEEEDFCATYCARIVNCSQSVSRTSCGLGCADYESTTIANEALLDAITPCMVSSSCPEVVSGDYHAKCYEEAASQVEPTAEVIAGCEAITRSNFECGFDADLGACVESMKVLKANYLGGALACSREASCQARLDCYERLWS